MKKTIILSFLFLAGVVAKAQDTGAASAAKQDTTSHRARHQWADRNQMGGQHAQPWGDKRGPAMAHRGGFGEGRGRGFEGRHGGFPAVHYTPEQRKQLMSITMDYKHKQEALYKQDNLTLGAYKAQLVALQKERKGKLEGLLTPDQKQSITKWKQGQSENQQVMAAARLERLKIRLQLSDDQAAKLKSQEADLRANMLTIRTNDDLLPDQKREQVMALLARQKEAVAAVLTPDQLTKWKQMQERRGHFDGGGRGFDGGPGGR